MTSPVQPSPDQPETAASGAQAYPPGSRYPLLPGVRSRMVQTPRLVLHVYESGPADGEPLVLVHGNASSARFFEDLMSALAGSRYSIVAPDMRGYGASDPAIVDATRGLRDYSDDVHALVETLGLARFHLLGWSLGGNIAMQYTLDHPERVRSLTLHAAGSPYGYGGTHGADGTPNYDDFAGSGGGLISPEVVEHYLAKDFTADSPFSPRNGLRQVILKPTFRLPPEREDALVEQMLMMVIGDQYYPGDKVASPNWPFVGPGIYGSNNGLSPKYPNQAGLAELRGGPAILWVHGADDQVVSNMAAVDIATLGKLGVVPGWPGDDVCPPQPMIDQIRAVLDRYAANGGSYREEVFDDCGHAPMLEKQAQFIELFLGFLAQAEAAETAGTGNAAEPAATSAAEPAIAPVTPAAAEPAPVAPPAPTPAAAPEPQSAPRKRSFLDRLLGRG